MNTPKLQKVVSIPFNEEEARVTLQLFDAAVRARGLEVAEVVAVLAKKINGAFLEGPTGTSGSVGPKGVQSDVLQ